MLSLDPLIVMRYYHRRFPETDVMSVMPQALRQAPSFMIVIPSFALEHPPEFDALIHLIDRAQTTHPQMKFIIPCNTEADRARLSSRGVRAVFVNQNSFADERVFIPLPDETIRFDAIYNATFLEWKRHELAAEIDRLALIGYMYWKAETESALARIHRVLPKAVILNPVVGGQLQWFDFATVNRCLNQAHVGLCLSAIEGAAFASIEYLLAGLPVVSTHSIGGRDVFFDPEFCRVVEPNVRAVREAVDDLISRGIPRQWVRERTIKKLEAHRKRFCTLIESLLRESEVSRDLVSEWPTLHRHQWLDWVDLDKFWQQIVEDRAKLRAGSSGA